MSKMKLVTFSPVQRVQRYKKLPLALEVNRMSSTIDLCSCERVFLLAVQTVLHCVMVNARSA